MASIEVITSQEREVTVKKANGAKFTATVRVWNETVSNLTLMALGSSAPEILLSVVEVCGHGFDAGELGPNTIVGSAAFNMFVIIGICVYVIPDGESRRVKHPRVFLVTAAWSVFAYAWLYLILACFSPGVVEIWEGLLTLSFFPACVGLAYAADRRLLFCKRVRRRYRAGERGGVIVETEGEPELPRDDGRANCGGAAPTAIRDADPSSTVAVDFQTRDGTAKAGSDFRFAEGTSVFGAGEAREEIRVDVDVDDDDIFEEEEERHFPVRLSGARVVSGGVGAADGDDSAGPPASPGTAAAAVFDDDRPGVFSFEEPAVTVSESVGAMEIRVVRTAGARGAVAVPYRTIEGTAKGGGEDFEDARGVLRFDDDQICPTFWVEMDEPRPLEMSRGKAVPLQEVGGFSLTVVSLPGRRLTGEEPLYGKLRQEDQRDPSSVRTISGVAFVKSPNDIEDDAGCSSGAHVQELIDVHDGAILRVCVCVCVCQNAVDEVLKKTRLAVLVGTTSWREQFAEAVTIGAGDDDGGKKPPSAPDYAVHFLTVFWKLLFALVPPADYWNGWACFAVSIAVIGVLTALIGDLASHFGCTVGLKDSVTAVVFVALGTSVPDTFASKVAACQDQYADASIGNVTGSNAVNVFLGIGVAWSIAAIYHRSRDQVFRVDPGTLAFSVTLFTVFAFVCIAVLIYRRRPRIGGELGGPPLAKTATAGLFFSLWLTYVVLSSLEAYCHIPGF
ncbi:sodium/calcium exchanger 1-like [Hippocampus comes]|uniref:sodium/calcium exchanger 1-like n=1 Tax=Hippocampus comes TaxID=109280 RepID=UPI00094E2BFC|nr:PREDICTED: sodium/calcium exchanger 1-like [Hippocampus comes]